MTVTSGGFCGFRSLLTLLALLLAACASQPTFAQPAAQSMTGELVAVEQKGRVTNLKVQPEQGDPLMLTVTPRLTIEVVAPGDEGLLRPGQFITTLATLSNERLFAKELKVHLLGNRRPPAGKIAKAPPQPGQGKSTFQVSGPILTREADPDYPEYQRLTLRVAGPAPPVMLEEGFTVQVQSNDVALIPVGSQVVLTGSALRGGRFNATKLRVELSEPFVSDEVLPEAPTTARP